ncbi:CPXCG motif-containing cysteine-rich protein [Winogradskyella bathintestinalis]|uniref:CPXCG motif-containing cysteine-rich protein n=1 Tax=Winogradskyella bathintestinalis TaxID=3035208 RepID=A0ABT7ZV45_9FLAO|nr:CPXCG motif-containing cysteine-rich protein [Winogradskyella bathintestinalis]MDN3492838.1 CPXCG motif-containing cysteine-rich protein [Winogradskyella bathintestinalis]
MDEYFFQCPYCWEQISMLVDTSQKQQNYIEDCEICCNPIQVTIAINDQEIVNFQAENIEQ